MLQQLASGLELVILPASTEPEIDAAFASAVRQHADTLIMEEAYFARRLQSVGKRAGCVGAARFKGRYHPHLVRTPSATENS